MLEIHQHDKADRHSSVKIYFHGFRGLGHFLNKLKMHFVCTNALLAMVVPNPDCYLRMKRIKQLYKELYKTENIEKFRSIIIPIERNAVA